MKHRMALLAVLLLALVPGLFAEPSWRWSTGVDTVVAIGDTRYLMEELAPYWVSSELIFPLNTLLARLSFQGERLRGRKDGGRGWGFEASVAANLISPLGKMQDYDWWMDPNVPKIPFSYTESDASMVWLAATLAWKPVLVSGPWGALAAVIGYRLQYVSQEINGYNGWVYEDTDSDGGYELYWQYGSGLVLTYWVLWNVPTAGVSVTLRPGPGVSVKLEAGAALPYVADEDDHVLRYKLSTASGFGYGGYASLAARYSWGKARSRVHPFLSLSVDGLALKAKTEQTQTYYAGATEAPPGTTSTGIDHQISTRQLAFVLAGGIEY
jgi:hypothetical protein